ncbi:MAG: hypothetical protein Q9217_006760, partial [Psora testacea]
FVNVQIKGWQGFTPEEKERCILKLRDELAQSLAVDVDVLKDKLNQVERSRSATPVCPPWEPDDPEGQEKESYEALVKDNGRPCYPIELGFDVFENPGQYKEILEYWHGESSHGLVFTKQLRDWESFRQRQQAIRCGYLPDRFHEFLEILRERRRIHGLDGELHLREDVAEQSKLDDWMEYQNNKLREYEGLKKKLKKCQEELASERKALAESGYSAFEEIEGLEFGKYYSMALEWSEKEGEAEEKEKLAERKLRMAKKRSEAAQSEELGERVERDRWIGWFTKEVELQRTRLDELQRLADEARRDVDPYNQWWDAKRIEWGEMREKDPKGAEQAIKLENKLAVFQKQFDKMMELGKRAYEVDSARFRAGEEVEFAEALLEAARTEDLAQTVERAALIKRTQKEVRFTEFHVEEEKELTKVLDLKRRVLDDLHSIQSLKGQMKRHNVLLDWIEQQRRELAGDSASAGRESGPRRPTGVRSGALRSPRATEASSVDHFAKTRARLQKPSMANSILSPVDPAKVSKASSRRRSPYQKVGTSCNTSQMAGKMPNDCGTFESRNEQASYVRNAMPASLRPIHSSRISKPGGKWRSGQRKNGTKVSTTGRCGEDKSKASSRPSTGGKSARSSVNSP